MSMEMKESDWKLFRRFHQLALERFCDRVLREVQTATTQNSDGYHHCYLKVIELIQERDQTMARAFNDPRRSNALLLLANINQEGLLTKEELMQFSPEARKVIETIESLRHA